jgi:ParB-like chromosome segregation protein Spo0J
MGERRVEASRRARRGDIPAIVKALSDEQAYDLQLIENIQRKDLTDMETARALKWRIDSFGYTQDTLAKKLGKTQGWISQRLAMLQIPETITRVIKDGEFTERQAREILAAPSDKQEKIVDEINKTGEVPSARELREIVHPKQTVLCDECGEPVENPVHLDGKFYHEACVQDVKDKSTKGLIEESPTHFEPETSLEPETEKETVPEEPPREDSPLRAVQIGEFDCTECHQHFLVEHLPNGKHALRLVGEDED